MVVTFYRVFVVCCHSLVQVTGNVFHVCTHTYPLHTPTSCVPIRDLFRCLRLLVSLIRMDTLVQQKMLGLSGDGEVHPSSYV